VVTTDGTMRSIRQTVHDLGVEAEHYREAARRSQARQPRVHGLTAV
jgi:hypothetical protein